VSPVTSGRSAGAGETATGTRPPSYRVGHPVGDLGEIDLILPLRRGHAGVHPGEQQQIVDQPGQPVDLGEYVLRTELGRAPGGDLQLGTQAGERAPQLVRGIRDERRVAGPGPPPAGRACRST